MGSVDSLEGVVADCGCGISLLSPAIVLPPDQFLSESYTFVIQALPHQQLARPRIRTFLDPALDIGVSRTFQEFGAPNPGKHDGVGSLAHIAERWWDNPGVVFHGYATAFADRDSRYCALHIARGREHKGLW